MVFPITTTPPAYYVMVRSKTRQSNVFYQTETGRAIDFITFSTTGSVGGATVAFTGSYEIRSYYGTQVATGTLAAVKSMPIPDGLPCGGYRIHLTQTTNDATYGFSGGAGQFIVVNADTHFKSMIGVTPTDSGTHGNLGDDCFMHGITLQGPRRGVTDDPTNSAFTTNIETGLTLDNTWYQSVLDSARPRPAIVTNVNLTTSGQISSLSALASTLAAAQPAIDIWWEGPANEPGGLSAAAVAADLQAFSGYIKAGHSASKVMGPCPVSFNGQNSQTSSAGFVYNTLVDLAAMSPVPIDGVSAHPYNCLNGDLSLGRKAYGQWIDNITNAGLAALPRFITEQGYWAMEHGALMPRLQGRWTMLMFLLEEQFGIPKEHHVIFFDADTGDYSFPSLYESGDKSYFPVAAMMRAYSAEIWGKTFTSAVDFGTPGNDMLLGNLYTNATSGDAILALQAAGSTDLSVNLAVVGASSLTVVDCFGNTSSVTVSSGVAPVPIALEPVYVRLPNGVTATVNHQWNSAALGSDLARSATASASGSAGATTASIMVSGNQVSTYFLNNQLTTRGQTNAPYIDDTGSFPAWATVTWGAAQTLDRVVVFAAPPWQAQGTLLDFDVQWLDADGTTWHTVQTITELAKYGPPSDSTANVLGHVSHAIAGGCTVESFFSDRWVFPIVFGSKVTTSAIRVYIRSATYGMDATVEAQTAKGSADTTTFSNNFTIRSVQAFNSTTGQGYVTTSVA